MVKKQQQSTNFKTEDVIESLSAMKERVQKYQGKYDSVDSVDGVPIEKAFKSRILGNFMLLNLALLACIEDLSFYQRELSEGRCYDDFDK